MPNSTNWSDASINSTSFTEASSSSTEYLPEQVSDAYNSSTREYNDSDTYYSGYQYNSPPLSTNWTSA